MRRNRVFVFFSTGILLRILKNIAVYGSSSQDVLNLYKKGLADVLIEWT